jgi:hypothetical protein
MTPYHHAVTPRHPDHVRLQVARAIYNNAVMHLKGKKAVPKRLRIGKSLSQQLAFGIRVNWVLPGKH